MKKSTNPLTLTEYKEKYGMPLTLIALRAGLSYHKVYAIILGHIPSLHTAVSLEMCTDGEVTCEKLLPKPVFDKIEKDRNEQKY